MEVENDANSRSVIKVHKEILISVKHMEVEREAFAVEIVQYIMISLLMEKYLLIIFRDEKQAPMMAAKRPLWSSMLQIVIA